ncbi:MAG: hypothetical protein A2X19_05095 [Bacteroidetes bacterium GWE2_39_28]|nr:MAG: hypothetical protein UU18_C0031G0009 [Parcubacteria group bacterium GW2011_GWB2_40_8]OFX77117.1 MAG: hypothetical protein A2X19_05095 [Bacteroidetes bacterium GWE2_39_28]OFY15268.1 MAG: hypothetical protein A2X16_09005 [Bacteroidetes bacterium GWF2_39_10]OFZ08714.1 MAG: hypothetical protein A2322_06435 [Bacteroidetes bacterium RIFOXYB2_FULL_39_7]OFZ11116.1 MAG: hypothetical protein A2465_02240 [Bacteroidetes bacterium RIFOXYC2_FULL_39_11]HCT93901.1 hypothetical protein [Rikenellaceae b
MKHYKILYAILLINLIITILSFIKITSNSHNIKNNELSADRLHFMSHMYLSVFNDNTLVNNTKLDSYIAYNKIENDDIMIIRYSQLDCKGCVDFVIKKVLTFFPNYSSTPKIVFLVSDLPFGVTPIHTNTIVLDKSELPNIPAEELKNPYIFIYNKGIIKHLFIPNTDNPEVLETYIQFIKSRYFKE